MKTPAAKALLHEQATRMIHTWFTKHYPLEHVSHGYIGMFGVWDVMGRHEIDTQIFVNGRTEFLLKMKDQLNVAIDAEVARREKITDGVL